MNTIKAIIAIPVITLVMIYAVVSLPIVAAIAVATGEDN